MAGYPPPYPYDPKQQARMARDQVKAQLRAQKAALRAQRDLYRYQTRAAIIGHRRSSILGPIIVLAAGVLVLLIRLGRIPLSNFGEWYGRWWPLLLVGAGVILVAEWAFDQLPRPEGTPYVRRGIGGGAIFLVILLAISGVIVSHLHDFHDDILQNFSFDPDSIDQFFGEKHETSATSEAAFAAGSSLVINNPHGDVTIAGKSDDNQIHVTVNKQIYSSSDSDANSKSNELSPRISQSGNVVSVSLPWLRGGTADLDITVPDFGDTTVTADHGDVSISGMHAPVTITANHGDIELNSITGAVSAHINNRDSTFTAHHITGDVAVRGNANDITVTDISGQVSLEGEFYGDTHFERVHGPVSFHTSRTQLNLGRLDGEVNISPHSDLTATQITGPTILKTRSRNITLGPVNGDVDVTNSDGSVDITDLPPLGNVQVENKNGEINLSVPMHSNFTVDAETKGGEIDNNLNLNSTTSNNRTSVNGSVGHGGPHVNLHTTHLDINIHEKDIAPPPPLPAPAPPALPKPTAPVKPATAPSKSPLPPKAPATPVTF
jgi:hypothetical protein